MFLDDFQGFSDRYCFRHFAKPFRHIVFREGPSFFPPLYLYIQVLSQNASRKLARRGTSESGEVFSWMLRHRPSFLSSMTN